MIGIVGSRRRNTLHDRKIVLELVDWLFHRDGEVSLVSGGCKDGADAFAEEAARLHRPRLQMITFPIDKEGVSTRWEFTERAYARNLRVARESSEIYCLVHSTRKGGTENTISHALAQSPAIPVYLVDDEGQVYLSPDGEYPRCDPVVALLGSSSIA